ncbi:hypothetical protein [Streptomyces sp. NPDC057877]|uniref:hypothetical protein n=1 Tax=Streptomyces sp. NPDC057877 TaxID=3346269 RepID=UPI0036858006
MAALNLAFADALATRVVGRVTFGVALLGLHGVVLIVSAAWYDRAFATRCDQLAEAVTSVREER